MVERARKVTGDVDNSPQADVVSMLSQFREQQQAQVWKKPFADYFQLVVQNPAIARLSHTRVYDMIMSEGAGVEGENKVPSYAFFENDLFGLGQPLAQLVEYFSGAAVGLEVRKRILMLMGPVGGGKSTIVTLLRQGLERYTETEAGAIYAIEGCPMNEEPLHLIPDAQRPAILDKYGLHIEGNLCPHCKNMVGEKYHGRREDVMVTRFIFSAQDRKGIGTFTPSDPKSQDISELTGSIDLATVGKFGSESDPRAFRFDGELNIANRGMMEFIEMLKCDEKFLYNLLTLSQEQNIKTGRFAMIYADEVIVSHTNETEYQAFINNKRQEALRDRLIVVTVPYNLRLTDEMRIYEKLLNESRLRLGKNTQRGEVHVAPNTLATAATFAVLTRLETPTKAGMTLMKKLKLYDGQPVEGFEPEDVKELREAAIREGMDGISPRMIINRLSVAIVKDGTTCINAIDALRSLKEGVEQDPGIDRERKEYLLNLISETRREYDEMAKKEIQRAFVYSFEESAKTLMNNYLDNVEAFNNRTKLKDPITGEDVEPDEQLMRSIEETIGVGENAKKAFREEIMIRMASITRRGQAFEYTSHDRLREAIEKKLFSDLKDIVKITTSTRTPDQDQLDKINQVAGRLVSDHGYCPSCANELLKYVGTLLSR